MAPEYLPSTSDDGAQFIEQEERKTLFTPELEELPHSFSDNDDRSGGASSGFNEELENDAFRELEAGLNDVMYHQKEAPPQLTALRCSGIGSPKRFGDFYVGKTN